jgi:hypothetical protein
LVNAVHRLSAHGATSSLPVALAKVRSQSDFPTFAIARCRAAICGVHDYALASRLRETARSWCAATRRSQLIVNTSGCAGRPRLGPSPSSGSARRMVPGRAADDRRQCGGRALVGGLGFGAAGIEQVLQLGREGVALFWRDPAQQDLCSTKKSTAWTLSSTSAARKPRTASPVCTASSAGSQRPSLTTKSASARWKGSSRSGWAHSRQFLDCPGSTPAGAGQQCLTMPT